MAIIVYPTVCGNDKGFLQSALSGGSFSGFLYSPTAGVASWTTVP